METFTPGFVDTTQATLIVSQMPEFDCGGKGTEKKSLDPSISGTKASVEAKTGKTTPQRPLREKNSADASLSNTTINNVSKTPTRKDRVPEKKRDVTPRALPKTQTQRAAMCFVCSGLPGNLTALVQKLAAQVGAHFSAKFDAKTTHLIVKTKEDNTTDKTLKYLCAVAGKKWVVSFQWAVDSIKEGKLLPEVRHYQEMHF